MKTVDLLTVANYALKLKKSAFGKELALIVADASSEKLKDIVDTFNGFEDNMKKVHETLKSIQEKEKPLKFKGARMIDEELTHFEEDLKNNVLKPLEAEARKSKGASQFPNLKAIRRAFDNFIEAFRKNADADDAQSKAAIELYQKLQKSCEAAFEKIKPFLSPSGTKNIAFESAVKKEDRVKLNSNWIHFIKGFGSAISSWEHI